MSGRTHQLHGLHKLLS